MYLLINDIYKISSNAEGQFRNIKIQEMAKRDNMNDPHTQCRQRNEQLYT